MPRVALVCGAIALVAHGLMRKRAVLARCGAAFAEELNCESH